jgi:hypothetical protein
MFSPRSFFLPVVALCVSASSLSAADEASYIQLKLGAEWTMDAQLMSAKGSSLPAVGRRVIEEEVEKGGKKYLRERTWMEMDGKKVGEYTKLLRKDGTGLYSIIEGQDDAAEKREIVLPLKVGQSWEFTVRDLVVKCTVIDLETVTIGSKTYENCFHLRSSSADGKYVEDYWEAPVDGSIKSEVTYADGTKIVLTLKEFKAGK